MKTLALGLVIFFSVHLFTGARSARAALINRLGESRYKGLYASLAFLGLILIIWGKANAPTEPFWDPPVFGRALALTLMPVAFVLLAASHMPSNVKRYTAHPMLWGIAWWATLHLLANGDRASVMLFGTFALYAFFAMVSQNSRGVKPKGERVPVIKDITVIVAGIVVSLAAVYAHVWLSGVPLRG